MAAVVPTQLIPTGMQMIGGPSIWSTVTVLTSQFSLQQEIMAGHFGALEMITGKVKSRFGMQPWLTVYLKGIRSSLIKAFPVLVQLQ